MNDAQDFSNTPTELATLIIPLSGKQLILPNEAVAEIVSRPSLDGVDSSSQWFLGFLNWRQRRIPVISFEALDGDGPPVVNNSSRFAVINRTGATESLDFWGLLIQDIPRLVRLTRDEIASNTMVEPGMMEQMVVSVLGEPASIPDLRLLEERIVKVLEEICSEQPNE